MPKVTELKTTFNEDAERYHDFRPHYPDALFEKLVADTHLSPNSRLLEIGPGTGQATEPMASRGYAIIAVELGDALADKARRVLHHYTNVEVITGAYEDVPLQDSSFDLVFSATAFHWILADYKYKKTANILKPQGYLAVIHTEHVSDEHDDVFFRASQPIYNKYSQNGSSVDNDFQLPSLAELKAPAVDTTMFTLKSFTTYPFRMTYTGDEYAGLLSTYSPTIAMPPNERDAFLESIRNLVDTQFNGVADRNFAMTLTIARKI